MTQAQTKTQETNTDVQEFDIKPRNFNEIVIVLTFDDTPLIFRLSRKLSDELQKEREEYYGLNEEDQKSRSREFRTNQLSHLLLECPQNVPGVENNGDWRSQFNQFIKDYPEFVNWIWGQYQTKLFPKELLLRASG